MELSTSFLQNLAETNPGNFAIYMVKNGALADVYHSSSLAALSGLSQKEYLELTSLNAQEVVALNDRERVKAALTQLLVDKKDIDLTYRIFHKSQGFVWVHAKCRYLGELEGAPVVYSIFEDTSGEADVHAQLLSDTSSIIYVVDSLTYEVLYANQQALRFWGKEDYTNAKCFNFIRKEKGVCQNCLLHQLVNGHYHENAVYYETLGKWVNIDAHAINWHGRDAVAFYANDVTEQQKRQASLEVDNRSLETTINNIPVGVGVCLFKDGKITTTILNKTLVSLWGMEGKPFSFSDPALFAKIHPEDRPLLAKMFCQIPTRTEPFEFVFRYQVDPSQPYRYLHTQCSFLVQGQERLIFLCFSDVTKSRLSELQLNQERKVYEFAVQETGIVAWQYDIPNHQVIISEQQRIKPFSLLQPTKGVLKNVPDCFETVIEPESLPALRELYRKVDSGEEKASAEIWFKASEKEGRTCERISYTIIASEGGKPLLAYGISQNITALKKDEERYLQAYKELEGARPNATAAFKLNLTQDCYFLAKDSPLGSYEKRGKVNDFIRRFGSVIDDEKLQKDFWTRYNRDSLLAFFRNGQTKFTLEYPMKRKNEPSHEEQALLYLFQNPTTGEIEGLAYSLDISEKKKNERIIDHLTQEKYDYIAILYVKQKTIEFVNVHPSIQFEKAGGSAPYDDWQSYVATHFLKPSEQADYEKMTKLSKIQKDLNENGVYSYAFNHLQNGVPSRRQIQYTWLDKEKGLILDLRSDITASYLAEQKQLALLQDALKKAQEANQAKTEFVSRISHDIRTPISISKNMTAFALEDIDNKDKLQDDLRKIEASNVFLLSLVNDVLDISKIDAGKIELHPEPYVFEDYMSAVRNMFDPLCEQKGLDFTVYEKEHDSSVLVDHIRLNQITLNLLSNAVKYTPEGGHILFQAGSKKGSDGLVHCMIEVKDDGIGMSEEFQKKMFDPFSQEYNNPSRPKNSTGTGLGLAIVKRIVLLLNGTIKVTSKRGKGTDIIVNFVAPEYHPEELQKATPKPFVSVTLSGKVLLAEDNEINAAIAQRILRGLGLEVEWASNGLLAVKAFKKSKPNDYLAILMDIQMPLLNGYEATTKIRSLTREDAKSIPIIAMTADAFNAALEKSKEVGMNDYVTKPLDPALLREALLKAKQNLY